MKTLRLTVAFLAFVSIFTTGCATDRAVISQAAQVNTQLSPAIMNDPTLSAYFQDVGDRIISTAHDLDKQGFGPKTHKNGDNAWMFSNNMKFHLVNSKTVNAFTTGGEHMYIYDALFQMAKDEDELAAVMAHEYGHVYARHVAKGMDRQKGALGVMLLGAGAGYAAGGKEKGAEYAALGAGVGGALGSFMNMGFTRGDEAEADKLGFNFYTHAGWDPRRFAAFFQQMIDAGYDKTPAIASDHPTLASRVEDANRRVKELPANAKEWRRPPVATPEKFKELQARARQLAATTPSDKTLAQSQQLAQALPRSCLIPYTTKDEVEARKAIVNRSQKPAKKK